MNKTMSADRRRHVQALRAGLLSMADAGQATAVANILGQQIHEALNDTSISAATSLYARVLIVRGMMQVAAAWWNDIIPDEALPELAAALRDIADNPPTTLETIIDNKG